MEEQAQSTILWQGKVAVKKFGFATTKYAYIFEDKIVITKNARPNAKVLKNIPRGSITSIGFPKLGTKEILLTGVRGFIVRYNEGNKEKKVNFWANSFGAFPDDAGMKALTAAMAVYVGKPKEEVQHYAESMAVSKYALIAVSLIIGFVWASLMGAIFFGLAAAGTIAVNNKKNLGTAAKVLLIIGMYTAAFIVSLILQVALLLMLGFSEN